MASVGHFRDEQGRSAFRVFAPLALQVDVRGGCAYDHASTQRDAIRFMTPHVRLKNRAGSCAGPRAHRIRATITDRTHQVIGDAVHLPRLSAPGGSVVTLNQFRCGNQLRQRATQKPVICRATHAGVRGGERRRFQSTEMPRSRVSIASQQSRPLRPRQSTTHRCEQLHPTRSNALPWESGRGRRQPESERGVWLVGG